jgi:ribosomal protein S7
MSINILLFKSYLPGKTISRKTTPAIALNYCYSGPINNSRARFFSSPAKTVKRAPLKQWLPLYRRLRRNPALSAIVRRSQSYVSWFHIRKAVVKKKKKKIIIRPARPLIQFRHSLSRYILLYYSKRLHLRRRRTLHYFYMSKKIIFSNPARGVRKSITRFWRYVPRSPSPLPGAAEYRASRRALYMNYLKAKRASLRRLKLFSSNPSFFKSSKRCVSLTPNRVLNFVKPNRPFDWNFGRNEDDRYMDASFGQDMVNSKKQRFNMFKYNPVSGKSLDLNPRKFFFYRLKKDPAYDSFLLEKIISAFSKHGRKSLVRKVFYRIFLSHKYRYNIYTLYSLIGALRPLYINVPVRMANRYYYAPIRASPMRSTMRAIRFFKMGVFANKHVSSLEAKILAELSNTFEFWGYVNPFYHDYVTMSENNKYLAHFRKRRII